MRKSKEFKVKVILYLLIVIWFVPGFILGSIIATISQITNSLKGEHSSETWLEKTMIVAIWPALEFLTILSKKTYFEWIHNEVL